MNAKLNKRERKARQLLAHYATCERLAAYLGDTNPDGKRISVALWRIERQAAQVNKDLCNIPNVQDQTDAEIDLCRKLVRDIFGKRPPGFFINRDPRGYALKIDNETPEGRALIEAVKLHTDWGGYGILSPEIDGD